MADASVQGVRTGTAHRREIDGLRAVAVLPVILFHAEVDAFSGGYVGVDIFFVISGYLITGILGAGLAEGRFSLLRFFERRARRILPALALVTASCVPFAWLLMLPNELMHFGYSVAGVGLFVSNVYFWSRTGYFDPAVEQSPLLHTWSLAVEEQFYLVCPVLLLLLWCRGERVVFWTLLALCLTSLGLAEGLSRIAPNASFYLLPTRAWELGLGALLALAERSVPRRESAALAFLGLSLIAASVLSFDEASRVPGALALIPTIGAALVLRYGSAAGLAGRLLSSRVFVGIGLVSYSAYLWHQPMLAFLRAYSPVAPTPGQLTVLLLALALLSTMTWALVEQPARDATRGSRSTVFGLAAAMTAGFVVFGVGAHATSGFLALRYDVESVKLIRAIETSPRRNDCHFERGDDIDPASACRLSSANAPIAVLGNSHGVEVAWALAEAIGPEGPGVRQHTISGCLPVYGEDAGARHCRKWSKETIDFLADDEETTTVVVAYRNDHMKSVHARALRRTVLTLRQHGKRVIVLLQAPLLDDHVEAYVVGRYARGTRPAGVDRNAWEARYAPVRQLVATLPDDVIIVDSMDALCDEQRCHAIADGEALYFDFQHVSMAGARRLAALLLPQLGALP